MFWPLPAQPYDDGAQGLNPIPFARDSALRFLICALWISVLLAGARAGAEDSAPDVDQQVVDLSYTMQLNGFLRSSSDQIANYIRFQTQENTDKVARGDQFDRLELEQQAQDHRDHLRKRFFQIRNLRLTPVDTVDIAKVGFLVRCRLPCRLDSDEHQDSAKHPEEFSGGLSSYSVDSSERWPGLSNCWYLKKGGRMAACGSDQAARAVLAEGGYLYVPDGRVSELVLSFDLSTGKMLSRQLNDYSVNIIVENLRWEKPFDWGFYERKALIDSLWDCGKLTRHNNTGEVLSEAAPLYFRPDLDRNELVPNTVLASLVSVEIIDSSGISIGKFAQEHKSRNLIYPPVAWRDTSRVDTQPIGPCAGIWKASSGSLFAIEDDGSSIVMRLASTDSNLFRFEGNLTRTLPEAKKSATVQGALSVVFRDDPLNKPNAPHTRKIAIKAFELSDRDKLRLAFDRLIWNSYGKVVKRQADSLDLRRVLSGE